MVFVCVTHRASTIEGKTNIRINFSKQYVTKVQLWAFGAPNEGLWRAACDNLQTAGYKVKG